MSWVPGAVEWLGSSRALPEAVRVWVPSRAVVTVQVKVVLPVVVPAVAVTVVV